MKVNMLVNIRTLNIVLSIKKYILQPIACKCGSVVLYCNMSTHRKSKKCLRFMEEKAQEKTEIDQLRERLERLESLVDIKMT